MSAGRTLCVGGGVAANARFREKMSQTAAKEGFQLYIAPLALCTDNAVMGAIAVERYRAGLFEPLTLDVFPGLVRLSSSRQGGIEKKQRMEDD